MVAKSFRVTVYIDLHQVSCPGVWLCPKGRMFLTVTLFRCTECTKQVKPTFPLKFHERFVFDKVFDNVNSLSELEKELSKRSVALEMVQVFKGRLRVVTLAVFQAPLTNILFPTVVEGSPFGAAEVDLLFEPCKPYPGIICPKAEVTTKAVVEELNALPKYNEGPLNPVTVTSKKKVKNGGKTRQQAVCHTRPTKSCPCACLDTLQAESSNDFTQRRMRGYEGEGEREEQPANRETKSTYPRNKPESTLPQAPTRRISKGADEQVRRDESPPVCDCYVCIPCRQNIQTMFGKPCRCPNNPGESEEDGYDSERVSPIPSPAEVSQEVLQARPEPTRLKPNVTLPLMTATTQTQTTGLCQCTGPDELENADAGWQHQKEERTNQRKEQIHHKNNEQRNGYLKRREVQDNSCRCARMRSAYHQALSSYISSLRRVLLCPVCNLLTESEIASVILKKKFPLHRKCVKSCICQFS